MYDVPLPGRFVPIEVIASVAAASLNQPVAYFRYTGPCSAFVSASGALRVILNTAGSQIAYSTVFVPFAEILPLTIVPAV